MLYAVCRLHAVQCRADINASSVVCADRGHAAARGRRRQKGTLIVYQVPYSEHSSFSELQQFVRFMQPQRLIPSVGNDSGIKAAQMKAVLES